MITHGYRFFEAAVDSISLNMCTGKHKHDCLVDAQKQANKKRLDLVAYKCLVCGFFHVGHRAAKAPDNLKRCKQKVRRAKKIVNNIERKKRNKRKTT